MKPYLTLCTVGTVLSVPIVYDDFATEQFVDRAEMSQGELGSMQDFDYPDVQSYADTQG